MHYFSFKKDVLYCEGVAVPEIARKIGTPFYCYSYRTLTEHFMKLKKAFAPIKPLICYSMKSNSNAAVLKSLVSKGAGLDIVSGGELYRGLKVGCNPKKMVYAGVGKTHKELTEALRAGILLFNVESTQELSAISQVAGKQKKVARASIRINPDVDAKTHAYITTAKAENKFGINLEIAEELCQKQYLFKNVSIEGLHIHIGSQITQAEPFVQAIKKTLRFMDRMKAKGIHFKYLNLGGGLGIVYNDEHPLTADEFAKKIMPLIKNAGYKIIFEPGRFIMGNSGIFVTKVTYVKRGTKKSFLIVDGGMNDLVRPSLYGSYHAVTPVMQDEKRGYNTVDIVGPICESGDFLAKDREIQEVASGEMVAFFGAGAYGFTMSSNYNSRPRVAEVLVKGNDFELVRKRETYNDLIRGERIPSFLKQKSPKMKRK